MTIITKNTPFDSLPVQNAPKSSGVVPAEITRTKEVTVGEIKLGPQSMNQDDNKNLPEASAQIVQRVERKSYTTTPENILVAQYVDEYGQVQRIYPSPEEIRRYQQMSEIVKGA